MMKRYQFVAYDYRNDDYALEGEVVARNPELAIAAANHEIAHTLHRPDCYCGSIHGGQPIEGGA